MSNLVDLGVVLTEEARKKAFKGQSYGFKQPDGTVDSYVVIRINKAKKSVWAEKRKLMTAEEAEEHERKRLKK